MKTNTLICLTVLVLVSSLTIGCGGPDEPTIDGTVSVDDGPTDGQQTDGATPVVSCMGVKDGTACGVPSCLVKNNEFGIPQSSVISYGGCASGSCVQPKEITCGDTLHHPCVMTSSGAVCQTASP